MPCVSKLKHIDRHLRIKGFARHTSFGVFARGPSYNVSWNIKSLAKKAVGAITHAKEKDDYSFAPRVPDIPY